MDGTNAAPTPYQRQYFQEIQPEFRDRMAEVNPIYQGHGASME
jgi:hypothetical protein